MMVRALIRANAHLPGHPRGDVWEVDLDGWQIRRAASGQTSIVKTWDDDVAARVAAARVDEVLGWVADGTLDVDAAIVAERDGRGRVGILDRLTTPGADVSDDVPDGPDLPGPDGDVEA